MATLLEIIEALDSYNFDKKGKFDDLYSKAFPVLPKDGEDVGVQQYF